MEHAVPAAGARRSGWKGLALVAASLLVAITLAISFLAHRYWPFTQAQIRQALAESFSGDVTVRRFRSTYFPHPGCVAEGVVLRREAGGSGQLDLASVQRLTIQANYWDLVFRPGYIARIVAEGLRVSAPLRGSFTGRRRAEAPPGHTRVGEVVADGALIEVARHDEAAPLRFQIHHLTLSSVTENAQLSYRAALTNALPPGEIESEGKFGPWNFADPGQTALSGRYKLEGADLGVLPGIRGTLASTDDFEGVLERIETRGTIDVPNFEVKRSGNAVPVRASFQAVVNATNGDVILQKVRTVVLRTSISATGQILGEPGRDAARKTTSLDLRVEQGRIQDVLRLFVRGPAPPLTGITNFQAHLTAPPEGRMFLKELQLDGEFWVSGGEFTTLDTQKAVDALSERSQGMKTKDMPSDQMENVMSNLKGRVLLRNGIATLSDLYFEIPGARAKVNGTYDLINECVDLRGRLGTDAKLSEMTNGGFKSVLLKPFNGLFKGKHHEAVVYVKLTGTYSDPHAGFDLLPSRK
jgi:AsmA-like C-terminal region